MTTALNMVTNYLLKWTLILLKVLLGVSNEIMGERKPTEHLLVCLGHSVRAVKCCFHSGAFTGMYFLTWLFFSQ